MSLLTCRNVSFAYEGKTVLQNLDFSVEQDDYLCIVGENGAGKSTLLKGLLNLKKTCTGEIIYNPDLKPAEIGYLPQQAASQKDFPASVMEIVMSGRLSRLGRHPFYNEDDRTDVLKKMEMLEITNLKKRCYRELSGGQQQRVLLARALCSAKKLLILDEPVTGLDPIIASSMYHIISDIHKNEHIAIIMVSHDIHGAAEQSDHILHLGRNQLFFGATDDYIKSKPGKDFLGGAS